MNIKKRFVLLSARKLASYEHKVYLSQALNHEEQLLKNASLKMKRQLIDEGKKPNVLWIRDLKLQAKNGTEGTNVESEEANNSQWQRSTQTQLNLLTFMVRSLVDLRRQFFFANSVAWTDYDILCLIETLLTPDIPNDALFLPSFLKYRKDNRSENNMVES